MAYPRSCSSKQACIHVSPSQTFLLMMVSAVIALVLASIFSSVAVAVAAAEPPPGGYRFELTHVDAHGNFTKEELIRRAAQRSHIRSRRGDATAAATLLEPSYSTTPRESMVHFSQGEYLMEVKLKGELRKYQAITDTGSSLIWLKPKLSWRSVRRFFNLHRELPCTDALCANQQACTRACSYKIRYGDGLISSGPMYRETLRFPGGNLQDVDNDIAMGWSRETKCDAERPKCDLQKYDGTVGLGRGKQSLINQLKVPSFSYCLTTYDKPELKSPLLLGSPDALKDSCTTPNDDRCKVQATSLLPHPSRYYVHLEYIEMGGKRIDLPKPNMFIDSGATFTELEKTTHGKLLKLVRERVKSQFPNANEEEVDGTVCWNGATYVPDMSDLELHFAGGAVMYLHKNKIVELLDSKKQQHQLCLTIKATSKVSVLGNYQQQNIHMRFDVANNRLSFVKVNDCTKV